MKVLQLITSLNTGGAEKLVIDAVPVYQSGGLEVDTLLLLDNPSAFRDKLEKTSNRKVSGLTKGSVYNPLLIFKLIPFLKKYDLVHVHLFPAIYWAVLAKWISFSKTPLIFTEHCTENRRMEYLLFRWVDRLIYRGLTKIITISDAVDAIIKKHLNFNASHFVLIENGIDLNSFTSALPYPKTDFFGENDFVLIQISGFREQKDQPTLIRAMKLLPDDIKLLLVGDGVLKTDNEQLVKKLGLEKRVKFLAVRTDVPRLLQTADVVILSSYYEGLSLSSIEGMACKPFIASDVPGLTEIVKGYGLLFKTGDEKALAAHVQNLRNDTAFYNNIKAQCTARAHDFEIQNMIKAYMKLYKVVLKV